MVDKSIHMKLRFQAAVCVATPCTIPSAGCTLGLFQALWEAWWCSLSTWVACILQAASFGDRCEVVGSSCPWPIQLIIVEQQMQNMIYFHCLKIMGFRILLSSSSQGYPLRDGGDHPSGSVQLSIGWLHFYSKCMGSLSLAKCYSFITHNIL